jgi:hypothetical protein
MSRVQLESKLAELVLFYEKVAGQLVNALINFIFGINDNYHTEGNDTL